MVSQSYDIFLLLAREVRSTAFRAVPSQCNCNRIDKHKEDMAEDECTLKQSNRYGQGNKLVPSPPAPIDPFRSTSVSSHMMRASWLIDSHS